MDFLYQDKPVGVVVSAWTPVENDDGSEPHCCMRHVVGTDPNDVANRVAFIEKTPRVRIGSGLKPDHLNWEEGPKGRGGSSVFDETLEQAEVYGYYPPSRQWCDARLKELGYILAEELDEPAPESGPITIIIPV